MKWHEADRWQRIIWSWREVGWSRHEMIEGFGQQCRCTFILETHDVILGIDLAPRLGCIADGENGTSGGRIAATALGYVVAIAPAPSLEKDINVITTGPSRLVSHGRALCHTNRRCTFFGTMRLQESERSRRTPGPG